ncbi:hypothetical protein E3J62_11105 [candidate division TA06 bacterium]|uniref:DUF91 domain-containing protein n=1 Tax=candidate division TA06 bacterium TaxID=2250710 RepID=A0A523UNN6_UNCT6|nr:MAG: hypothetical protein E3J62_11105 [candidate division TA06 bacterium]
MKQTHVALKCNYNNGREGILVGFEGVCSEDIMKRNIDNRRPWCSNRRSLCKKYYDKGFRGTRPKGKVCYESALFKDWEFGAGYHLTGIHAGKPMRIPNVGVGKIAVLTTVFPGEKDIDRNIIGLFRIGKVDDTKETLVTADRKYRVRLPLEEAKELFFWDYYTKKPPFGSHLHRYLDDIQVAQILRDLVESSADESVRRKAEALLTEIRVRLGSTQIPAPSGPRAKGRYRAALRTSIRRKYGPGGEGKEHRRLKKWVAQNPSFLGLGAQDVLKTEEENHRFPSGDLPDIVFVCRNNRYVIVEIETIDTLPGVYQAIKYKALMCAEQNLPLGSRNVEAFLVAYDIPMDSTKLCRRYSVKYKKKRL